MAKTEPSAIVQNPCETPTSQDPTNPKKWSSTDSHSYMPPVLTLMLNLYFAHTINLQGEQGKVIILNEILFIDFR